MQHLSYWRNSRHTITILQSVIFGFNTDVRHEDTVYHVQSEAQQSDTLLRTHIFVGGQCLGRCELSLAEGLLMPPRPDVQDILRRQHRQVLDCIRQGDVASLLTPVGLLIEWLEAAAESEGNRFALLFRVTASGCPLGCAYLVSRLDIVGGPPFFAHAETSDDGCATLHYSVQREAIANSTLLVEASHAGRKISARFLLHARQLAPTLTAAPTF